ncbi:MAG: serine protease [Acetobacteraceae bacterium]
MRRSLPALLLALVTAACASVPGPAAMNTPVERVATASYAAVVIGAPPLFGGLGSAVAIDERHVLTNAHVMRLAGLAVDGATLVRGDGARATATLVARSPSMDLAVLRVPAGFLAPAETARLPPLPGQPVWAAGTTTVGPGVATGTVLDPAVEIEGLGVGFVARMGALMGYSGGPVVGQNGRVLGLTTALVRPGAAPLLGMLTGADLDGLLSFDGREVFVLGIGPAMDEARRLLAAGGASAR